MTDRLLGVLRPYEAVQHDGLELQCLQHGGAPSGGDTALPLRSKRWRLPPWRELLVSLDTPRVQGRIWLAVAAALLSIAAAVWLFSALGASSSTTTRSPPPFPSVPWYAPAAAGLCTTRAAGDHSSGSGTANGAGQRLLLHKPLSYSVQLTFNADLLVVGAHQAPDRRGRSWPGRFLGAANITFAIGDTDTSCVSLHASGLEFTSISAMLLLDGGARGGAGGAPPPLPLPAACLCGTAAGCAVRDCGRLFAPDPDAAAVGAGGAWLLSLGPLVSPAGSTLLLVTRYVATLGPSRSGLWRTTFETGGAAQPPAALLSSELEMASARTVLPCVDEPRYKATFSVSVVVPEVTMPPLTVLSNMPQAGRRSLGGGLEEVSFLPTPPMSSYLLSIAVGHLQSLEATTRQGDHPVRVWVPDAPGWAAAGRAALRVAAAALEHYTLLSGLPPALPKHDLLAVPGKRGAIESWGLLTFDAERLLLPAPSAAAVLRAADVVCHELAHQWVGNLVTAVTWRDLLVNEGAASLLEYGCLAATLPVALGPSGAVALMAAWPTPRGRVPGVHEGPLARARDTDADPSVPPLLPASGTAAAFGATTYSKAAVTLAALAHVSGGDGSITGALPNSSLQVALQRFLRAHTYGTASAEQLLAAAAANNAGFVSALPALLAGWQQPGAPLLELQTRGLAAVGPPLIVRQRRFCSSGLLTPLQLDAMLAAAGRAAQLPLPDSGGLSCPGRTGLGTRAVQADVQEKEQDDDGLPAAPWVVAVKLITLPMGRAIPGPSCAAWQLLTQSSQELRLLPAACMRNGTSVLALLDGSGGWGMHWVLHTAPQRAVVRKWVTEHLQQQLSEELPRHQDTAQGDAVEAVPHAVGLLLAAARLLHDQATLSLSAFGEVPAEEGVQAFYAAAAAAAAAARATPAAAPPHGRLGFVAHVLLGPLLPAVEDLLSRLTGSSQASCWLQLRAAVGAALRPAALAAFAAFAAQVPQPDGVYDSVNALELWNSPDALLGAHVLSPLLAAAGLVDAIVAAQLCTRLNEVLAATKQRGSSTGKSETVTLAAAILQLHPDAVDAILDVAAARPSGCNLTITGGELVAQLRTMLERDIQPSGCVRAMFALAHSAAALRADGGDGAVQALLELLLLGLPGGVPLACGVPLSEHAVGLARTISAMLRRAASEDSWHEVGMPVVNWLMVHWQSLVEALGVSAAWQLMTALARDEVSTREQWQALATWALATNASRTQLRTTLGAAWGSVLWSQRAAAVACSAASWLPKK